MNPNETLRGLPAVRLDRLPLTERAALANALCTWRFALRARGLVIAETTEYERLCSRHTRYVNAPGSL